jgi:hypothetical protein
MFAMAVENLIRLGRGAGVGTARLELAQRLINYLALDEFGLSCRTCGLRRTVD